LPCELAAKPRSVSLHIYEGDIKGFVFQHNLEVYKFISAAVNLFD
jgi:hypothetical protein